MTKPASSTWLKPTASTFRAAAGRAVAGHARWLCSPATLVTSKNPTSRPIREPGSPASAHPRAIWCSTPRAHQIKTLTVAALMVQAGKPIPVGGRDIFCRSCRSKCETPCRPLARSGRSAPRLEMGTAGLTSRRRLFFEGEAVAIRHGPTKGADVSCVVIRPGGVTAGDALPVGARQ